jgi:hypothetical protein
VRVTPFRARTFEPPQVSHPLGSGCGNPPRVRITQGGGAGIASVWEHMVWGVRTG